MMMKKCKSPSQLKINMRRYELIRRDKKLLFLNKMFNKFKFFGGIIQALNLFLYYQHII